MRLSKARLIIIIFRVGMPRHNWNVTSWTSSSVNMTPHQNVLILWLIRFTWSWVCQYPPPYATSELHQTQSHTRVLLPTIRNAWGLIQCVWNVNTWSSCTGWWEWVGGIFRHRGPIDSSWMFRTLSSIHSPFHPPRGWILTTGCRKDH